MESSLGISNFLEENALTSNAEEAEVEQFYGDLQDLLELALYFSSQGTRMQK